METEEKKIKVLRPGDHVYMLYLDTLAKNPKEIFRQYAEIVTTYEEDKKYYVKVGNYVLARYVVLDFDDLDCIYFTDDVKALKIVESLPKAGKTVYRIIGNKIYKRIIYGYKVIYQKFKPTQFRFDKTYNIQVLFGNGKSISYENFCKTVFATKAEAQKALEKLKNN